MEGMALTEVASFDGEGCAIVWDELMVMWNLQAKGTVIKLCLVAYLVILVQC